MVSAHRWKKSTKSNETLDFESGSLNNGATVPRENRSNADFSFCYVLVLCCLSLWQSSHLRSLFREYRVLVTKSGLLWANELKRFLATRAIYLKLTAGLTKCLLTRISKLWFLRAALDAAEDGLCTKKASHVVESPTSGHLVVLVATVKEAGPSFPD